MDITIRWLGLTPPISRSPPIQARHWGADDTGWTLQYRGQEGRFWAFRFAPDGTALSIQHHSRWDKQDFLSLILGPASGAALHLRGTPCLHAAGVVIDGGAVLLIGNSEAGKSTLTSTLVHEGCPFLCDDLAPLESRAGRLAVVPGHPLLKLSPQSVLAQGGSPDTLTRVYPVRQRTEERWLDVRTLPSGFQETPVPLRVVYILAGREGEIRRPRFVTLSGAEACLELSKFFYGREWLMHPPEDVLSVSSCIARTAVIRKVWLPDDLGRLRDTARALIDDAHTPRTL